MNNFDIKSSERYVWENLKTNFPEVIKKNEEELINEKIKEAYERVLRNNGKTDDLGGFYEGTARNEQAVWNDFLDYVWDYTCDRCGKTSGCNYCSGYYKESQVVIRILEDIEELYIYEPYDMNCDYKNIYSENELAVMDDEDILKDVLCEISCDIANKEGVLDTCNGKIFESRFDEDEEIKEVLNNEFINRFSNKVELFAKHYDEIMEKKNNNEYWQNVVYEATKRVIKNEINKK
jgi:hypothetical protein